GPIVGRAALPTPYDLSLPPTTAAEAILRELRTTPSQRLGELIKWGEAILEKLETVRQRERFDPIRASLTRASLQPTINTWLGDIAEFIYRYHREKGDEVTSDVKA